MSYEDIKRQQAERRYSVAILEHSVTVRDNTMTMFQARCLNCSYLGKLREYQQDAIKDAKRHGEWHAVHGKDAKLTEHAHDRDGNSGRCFSCGEYA